MAAHCLRASIILIVLFVIIPHVASDNVYIVTSPKQCPQCLTLQQYITGNYTTNSTSLQILPGIHHIYSNDINISVSNIYSFEVNGSNATILCNGNYLKFREIDAVSIRGVWLMGCTGASFSSVRVLSIHSTGFEHHGPVIMNSISNATVMESTIINGRKLLVHSSTLLIMGTIFYNLTSSDSYFKWHQDPREGAIQTNNSNTTIGQRVFINNNPSNSSTEGWGGAVYANNTRLVVIDSYFIKNSAVGAGGAISANNCLIKIINSQFSHNIATVKGGAIHTVGLHTRSPILVYNCSFINNKAYLAGAALYTTGNNTNIIIKTSEFISNAAILKGGVLFVAGINNSVLVQRSCFAYNVAGYYGGVLHMTGNYSVVKVIRSSFRSNTAYTTGGTLYIVGNVSKVFIYQSEFNNSRAQGGGTLSLIGSYNTIYVDTSVFNNNRAVQMGGVMLVLGDYAYIRFRQCHFSNNTADIAGGAIYIYLKGYLPRLRIANSTFSNKSANVTGGTIYLKGYLPGLRIINSTFSNNTADIAGGAIYLKGYLPGLRITNSTFSNNSAARCAVLETELKLHVDFINSTFLHKLYVDFINSTFINNTAKGKSTGNTTGGVACLKQAFIYVKNSSFFHNEASGNAGVLFLENSSLWILQSFFNDNTGYNGGVLYTAASSPVGIAIIHSEFLHSMAAVDGGVMYVSSNGSQVTVMNNTFAYNHATGRGGVIAIFGSQLYFDHNTIFDNYGGVLSACRSNVTASDDLKQIEEPNPSNSYCTIYDAYQDTPMTTTNMNTAETTEARFTSIHPKTDAIPHTSTSETTTTPGTSTSETTTMPATTASEANTMPGTNQTPKSPGLTAKPTTPDSHKTTRDGSIMPTIPDDYATAIHTALGIAIVLCVLLALLYIIVLCIVLYLCGVFKPKKRLVDNPYVYMPMNESTADNETAPQ